MALYRAGYDYAIVVEHEDRQFEGTDEKIKAGFLIARNVVSPTSWSTFGSAANKLLASPPSSPPPLRLGVSPTCLFASL